MELEEGHTTMTCPSFVRFYVFLLYSSYCHLPSFECTFCSHFQHYLTRACPLWCSCFSILFVAILLLLICSSFLLFVSLTCSCSAWGASSLMVLVSWRIYSRGSWWAATMNLEETVVGMSMQLKMSWSSNFSRLPHIIHAGDVRD